MENIKQMKTIIKKIYIKLFFNKEPALDKINISVMKVY